ncbi:sulfatase [Alistipes sp.]|uniref:sulfatase family protein n=1 Tax=Alistipes sp. TaxID=1872444 RepID=UPI003AEFD420
MNKHRFTKCVATVGLIPLAVGCAQTAKQQRPNILFILSDDHTSQSWGIYGGVLAPYAHNANIARLAAEGCVLDNAFCTNSISVPSRAAILTGQYSHLNGVYTLDDALSPERDNIAKRLQQAGYRTALFGKWHLKKEPAGFDRYEVFHDQGTYRDPVFKSPENWVDDDKGIGGTVEKGFSTDLVTDKAIRWMRERDRSRPFSLFCHFKATHEPCDFPERFARLYDGVTFPEPENLLEFGSAQSGRTFPGQPLETMAWRWQKAYTDPENWWTYYPELPFEADGLDSVATRRAIYQKLVRDYLRCAAAIDDNIGRLLDELDRQGLAENTVMIYVSDQGYFLGEHGFFDKRIMYEEPLRMPFVIRYPREISTGTRNRDLVTNVDFASLLADYAGAEPPSEAQGRSFRDNLRGRTPGDWPRSMYYRYWTQHEIRPAHMGIRNERYKLIFFYGDRLGMTGSDDCTTAPSWEFYDLETDPHENRNRYGDPAYAAVIGRMKHELLALREKYRDTDEGSERMRRIMERYYDTALEQ